MLSLTLKHIMALDKFVSTSCAEVPGLFKPHSLPRVVSLMNKPFSSTHLLFGTPGLRDALFSGDGKTFYCIDHMYHHLPGSFKKQDSERWISVVLSLG